MNNRKAKRRMNHWAKKLKVGGYALICSGDPALITAKNINRRDPYGSDIECLSLMDNTMSNCSILHCGPEPLTKKQAFAHKKVLEIIRPLWEEWMASLQLDDSTVDMAKLTDDDLSSYRHNLILACDSAPHIEQQIKTLSFLDDNGCWFDNTPHIVAYKYLLDKFMKE